MQTRSETPRTIWQPNFRPQPATATQFPMCNGLYNEFSYPVSPKIVNQRFESLPHDRLIVRPKKELAFARDSRLIGVASLRR